MRIRTTKPEFWINPDLGKLPHFTRLLALALLNLADDEGYFLADPALLKSQLFPFDESSLNIQGAITELSNADYLRLYHGTNGRIYGQVTTFEKHQKINRPSPSKLKSYVIFNEPCGSTQGVLIEPSLLEQGSGIREKEQGKAEPAAQVVDFPSGLIDREFEAAWARWIAYRAERKLPKYKPVSAKAQLDELEEWGIGPAIEAINTSIRNQWQGLFDRRGITKPAALVVRTEAPYTKI